MPKYIRKIFQLPPDMAQKITDMAKAETERTGEEVSESAVVRAILRNYFKEKEE